MAATSKTSTSTSTSVEARSNFSHTSLHNRHKRRSSISSTRRRAAFTIARQVSLAASVARSALSPSNFEIILVNRRSSLSVKTSARPIADIARSMNRARLLWARTALIARVCSFLMRLKRRKTSSSGVSIRRGFGAPAGGDHGSIGFGSFASRGAKIGWAKILRRGGHGGCLTRAVRAFCSAGSSISVAVSPPDRAAARNAPRTMPRALAGARWSLGVLDVNKRPRRPSSIFHAMRTCRLVTSTSADAPCRVNSIKAASTVGLILITRGSRSDAGGEEHRSTPATGRPRAGPQPSSPRPGGLSPNVCARRLPGALPCRLPVAQR